MKTLSLKLDDSIFEDAEYIKNKLNLARNRYINEAVNIYNQFNKRKILKKQFASEAALTATESKKILQEFEKFVNADKTI